MGSRRARALVLLCVALVACAEERSKRRRSRDDDDDAPARRAETSASGATASARPATGEAQTIEQVLIDFTKKSPKEVKVPSYTARSLKCARLRLDGTSISEGDLITELAKTGLRVEVSDTRLRIHGRVRDLEPCDDASDASGYTIAGGVVTATPRASSVDPLASADPSSAPTFPRPSLPSRGRSAAYLAAVAAIKQISPTSFEIPSSAADVVKEEALKGLAANTTKRGVIVPKLEPDSLAAKLGLKEGDRILTANGFAIDDPDKAIDAYAKLRRAAKLTLKIERAGKPLELDYAIKD